MSGGELNFINHRLEDAAQTISASKNPLYLAFAKHLYKVAEALHDVDKVLSGDRSSPSEEPAIRAVISKADEINAAREEAERILKNLKKVLHVKTEESICRTCARAKTQPAGCRAQMDDITGCKGWKAEGKIL